MPNMDPMGPGGVFSLPEVRPDGVPYGRRAFAGSGYQQRRQQTPRFTSLEVMYGAYPQIARQGSIRVERIAPEWWDDGSGQRVKVKGVIADRYNPVGTQELARLFGGYKYRVYGQVEMESKDDVGGPPQLQDLACAELDFPIPPNLENLPLAEADALTAEGLHVPFGASMFTPYGRRQGAAGNPFYQQQYPQGFAQGGQSSGFDPQVLTPILNFASTMSNRQQAQPTADPRMSDAYWNVVGETTRDAQTNMRSLAEQNVAILQRQLEQARTEIQEERRRMAEQMNRPNDFVQTIEGVSKLVQAQKGSADSDVVRQMRDEHERTMRMLREDMERALAKAEQDAERALAREKEDKTARVALLETRQGELTKQLDRREREYKDEIERKERTVRDEMQRTLDAREREYQQRISDVKDNHAREIAAVKESHERESKMRELLLTNTSKTQETAHSIEMRSLQTDIAKLTAELEEKRKLVEQAMREKNKPLIEQVQEVQQMSSALSEMAGKPEPETPATGEEKWYNSPIVKQVASTILTMAPSVVPKIGEAIKGKGKAAPNPMPQQGAPPMMIPPGADPRLPARRPKRMVFSDSDVLPMARTDLPTPSYSEQGATAGQVQMAGPRPFESGPGPAQHQAPVEPVQYQPQPQPAAAPAAQPQQPVGDPWAPFDWLPLDRSGIMTLITQLDQACQQKISPVAVADQFVSAYPMPVVAQINKIFEVSRLVETIRTAPATAKLTLASGRGRRFIESVWAELKRRADKWEAEQASGGGEEKPAEEAGKETAKEAEVSE